MPTSLTVRVRFATPADARAIATVHVSAWREAYSGIVPEDFLAALSWDERRAMWDRALGVYAEHQVVLVADDQADGVVGFASGAPSRGSTADARGELMTLYVLRRYQGNGIGRRLFEGVVASLANRGCTSLLVWVLAANPARGFYERMGGRLGESKEEDLGGVMLEEVSYVWESLPLRTGGADG